MFCYSLFALSFALSALALPVEVRQAAPPPPPAGAGGDPQTSTTLDAKSISKGFAQDGTQGQGAEAGQVPSLTSTNNFINFCLTTGQQLSDGKQVKEGACNQAPMGSMPAVGNMPSSKFVNPKNLDTIEADKTFTIQMKYLNVQTGSFVNPNTNYYSAPQQLNQQGLIIGHTHVAVERLDSLTSTNPTDPQKFQFFKGINTPADANGIVSATVDGGLPAGTYRLASMNAAMNHQPVLVPVAQHGALDDHIYFTVGAAGAGAAAGQAGAAPPAAPPAAGAAPPAAPPAAGAAAPPAPPAAGAPA